MTDFPITPPPELVRQWMERTEYDEHTWFYESYIAEQAANWGSDQELEACLVEVSFFGSRVLADKIRAARRPKPPSLKEQALTALSEADQGLNKSEWQQCSNTIRRALEALPE